MVTLVPLFGDFAVAGVPSLFQVTSAFAAAASVEELVPGAVVCVGGGVPGVVDAAGRDRVYAEQARRYPGFADYERQTAGIRTIPVLELTRA